MQNISNKFSRNKIENEKNDIYMEIENAQIKKANLLLDMGIMTYEKIRNEIIIDDSFDNICNEILEIDKLIYNNNLRIKKLEEKDEKLLRLEIENAYLKELRRIRLQEKMKKKQGLPKTSEDNTH